MSVIAKVESSATLGSMQFLFRVNESSTLQLINGICNDLQKLLKYFNGTAIFTPFFIPLLSVLPIRFALFLNEGALSSLVISALLIISSLLKFHKLPEVSE